jgi:hypothetical protein
MGALQPALPCPAMIPEGFAITVIDLKDCCFTIPLQDNDKETFAFTLPSINNEIQLNYINRKYYLRHEKQSHHMLGLYPCRSYTLL